MNGPHEIHLVLVCHLHQLRDTGCVLGRIRFSPVGRTMIRIVFRPVNIRVQFILPVKTQLPQTGLMAPRSTIKSLDHAPETNVGIIPDFNLRQMIISKQLHEGTHGIVRSPLVIARKRDPFGVYFQIITFRLLRNLTFPGLHGPIALFSQVQRQSFR